MKSLKSFISESISPAKLTPIKKVLKSSDGRQTKELVNDFASACEKAGAEQIKDEGYLNTVKIQDDVKAGKCVVAWVGEGNYGYVIQVVSKDMNVVCDGYRIKHGYPKVLQWLYPKNYVCYRFDDELGEALADFVEKEIVRKK